MNKDSINLPAIPLRGITIFPNMIIHFDVGREKSISALEESMLKDSKIFLVSQIDPEIEEPKRNEIYSIGTICKIKQILKLPKGVTRVLVEGVERAAIIDLIDDKKFMEVVVEKIDDELNLKDENEDSALRNLLSKAFKEYIRVTEGDESKVIEVITKEEELGKVTDLIAAYIQLDEDKKQTILETINVGERIEKLLVFIKEEVEIVKIENSIGKKVKNKLDKSNKEYFLREQLKVIQEELGEDDEKNEILEFNLISTLALLSFLDKAFIISDDLSDSGNILPPRSIFNFVPSLSIISITSLLVNEYKALYKKCGLPGI